MISLQSHDGRLVRFVRCLFLTGVEGAMSKRSMRGIVAPDFGLPILPSAPALSAGE